MCSQASESCSCATAMPVNHLHLILSYCNESRGRFTQRLFCGVLWLTITVTCQRFSHV
jgi:hypothetical protein